MDTRAMKTTLATRLQEAGTCFTASDISIRKHGDRARVVIREYEHNPFEIRTEYDDFFGYVVWIADLFTRDEAVFVDSKRGYNFDEAMAELGYYIANRF